MTTTELIVLPPFNASPSQPSAPWNTPTRVWFTHEFMEDSLIPPETLFGYNCRCVVLFDEPEFGTPEYDEWERHENQKAMDAFWSERPTR